MTDIYGRPWRRKDILACVGPGWRRLVEKLIEDLQDLDWNGQLHQIKEKFGGLRFYIGDGTETMHNRIMQAEEESLHTCSDCGEEMTELKHKGSWIYPLCDGCWKEER